VPLKTLLLNPPSVHRGAYVSREQCGIGVVGERFVPSEMMLAAAYLRQHGHSVEVRDADLEQVELEHFDVVVVWISVLHTYRQDLAWASRAKQVGCRTVVVLNDPYDGFENRTLCDNPDIDAAVRLWERERSLAALLEAWDGGAAPRSPGLVVREGSRLVDTGLAPRRPDLSHLTSCAPELGRRPVERYSAAAITPGRGCTAGCGFCLYAGSGSRKRRLEDVLAEVEAVIGRTRRLLVLDPDLGADREWMERFCGELRRMGAPLLWRTDLRPEHARPEVLAMLRSAGCDQVLMAVETLDPRIRDRVGAGIDADELRCAIRMTRRSGIRPHVYFVVGLPWDGPESLSRLLVFLRKEPIARFFLKQVRPWPGTPVHRAFADLGLIDRELGPSDFVSSGSPLCPTQHLSREELEEWKYRIGRASIFNLVYLYRFFRERRLTWRHLRQGVALLAGRNIFRGA